MPLTVLSVFPGDPRASNRLVRQTVVAMLAAAVFAVIAILVRGNRQAESAMAAGPTPHAVRVERRAFEGAPPVIPHPSGLGQCSVCHTDEGRETPPLGFAPAHPHGKTAGMSSQSRCVQCHVYQRTTAVFVESAEPMRVVVTSPHGPRAFGGAPPVIPHAFFMREDCRACHAGPAARPEIRCTHPTRIRCTQCHVFQQAEPVSETAFGLATSTGVEGERRVLQP